MSGLDVPWSAEDTMSPLGALVGAGVKKVSWRVGRSGFSLWHVVFAERDGEVRTACNIPVPPKQNVPRNYITAAVPVSDACERCWPPQPEAA